MNAMIALARHTKIICSQISNVAEHAISGCRSDDTSTIGAMSEIVATLRRSADAIDRERCRREAEARSRAQCNALLYG